MASFDEMFQMVSDLNIMVLSFVAQFSIIMFKNKSEREQFKKDVPFEAMLKAWVHMLLVVRGYINLDIPHRDVKKSVKRFKKACTELMEV